MKKRCGQRFWCWNVLYSLVYQKLERNGMRNSTRMVRLWYIDGSEKILILKNFNDMAVFAKYF